jgi:hypothetical protein
VLNQFSEATWLPLTPESTAQSRIRPVQVIFHTIVGSAAGAIRVMQRGDLPGESHLINPFAGRMTQLMPFDVRADCNWQVNSWRTPAALELANGVTVPVGTTVGAISIESEDDGTPEDTPWNANQLENFVRFLVFAHRELDIPLHRCPHPFQPGVGYHSMPGLNRLASWDPHLTAGPFGSFIDPRGRKVNIWNPWTNTVGKSCPGPARIAQFDDIVAEARRRIAPPPVIESPDPQLPAPSPQEAFRMFVIVGNADNKTDPRRWVWDGATSLRRLHAPADYDQLVANERVGLIKLHPHFATLASPYWMSGVERAKYGQD